MSLKELKEAFENEKLVFGIKQAMKLSKGKKKSFKVFVASDSRKETLDKLEKAKIEFSVSKSKKEISKELDLDFESEVFSIN